MNVAQLLIPDFSLILCSYLVCHHTALNRTVWQQVESLVYYFLFPVLLFQSIVKSPLDLGATSRLMTAALACLLRLDGAQTSAPARHQPGPQLTDFANSPTA